VKLCHEPPTKPKITNKQSFILQKNAKVNLDFAARVIHGVTLPEAVMKTRIRRLYDIANILQSLQLIQKVQVTESNGVKKPAFQYIGPDVDSMGKVFLNTYVFIKQ
jgi:transcription factor E2F7/8